MSYAVPALLLLSAGCRLPPEERARLLSANESYRQGRYAQATQQLDQFLTANADRPEAAEALYLRGLARLRQKQREPARADLRAALAKSQREDLTARAHVQLGSFAFDDADWPAAVEHFRHAVRKLPRTEPTDQFLYRNAVALQRVGQWDEARLQYAMVLHFFPNGPAEPAARRKFAWREHHFAIQCGVYRQRDAAHEQIADLAAHGLRAAVRLEIRDADAVWIVYVGQYGTYAQARLALPRVQQARPDAFIVP